MNKFDQILKSILEKYPDNANCWSQADDLIRDVTRSVRKSYNELMLDVTENDDGYIEPLDFRSFTTPSEWNTKAKQQINELWGKMDDWAKENALHLFISNN